MIDRTELWIVILALGLGSFGLRFVFLGLVGDKAMPDWVLRHLRYTAVSVLPALVAPLVVWPGATGGEIDPPRLIAALV
ncbi:MAG: AzlD domain-containing protein, partial [Pseudomonadota bacterium]|nr:AzlD domain-containing protein [Pseudomonadota bacterium]